MNRKIYILSAVAAMAAFSTSCSDDDSNNNNNNPQTPSVELFTASSTSGKVSITDLSTTDGDVYSVSVSEANEDCDGIFYDPAADEIVLASRTKTRLNIYGGIRNAIANNAPLLTLAGNSSNVDFDSPREIAVSGNKVFVVQDQSATSGKIFVYEKTGTTLARIKTYTVDFKLWGIHVEGNDLWAVVDNTGDIAKFENILSTAEGAIFPTKKITIEGLVRTHGITYSAQDDTMVLTDIGDAAVATDGGVIIIDNFTQKFGNVASGGTMALAMQKRIYGPNSTLGNPVDVAYDHVTNKVYVAEKLNAGGRVLTFTLPNSSVPVDAAPVHARSEAGVTSVYLSRR